jgi:pyridoxal phosphate enzyme (YggS family)
VTAPLDEIPARLGSVRERIARAAERAGRDPAGVALVAVTKVHPKAAVRAAYDAGQRLFGENYVQELVDKAAELASLEGLRWHFIGHLQRNKVKPVLRVGAVIETVDSIRLGEEIAKRSTALGVTTQVLVQVNVAGEAQKSGCALGDAPALVAELRKAVGLDVRGLMTIPPHDDDPEVTRPHFRTLRELGETLSLPELSMGMTHDLEVAVEEGATIVRVGTAIFGPR